jgi:hypothetical protein
MLSRRTWCARAPLALLAGLPLVTLLALLAGLPLITLLALLAGLPLITPIALSAGLPLITLLALLASLPLRTLLSRGGLAAELRLYCNRSETMARKITAVTSDVFIWFSPSMFRCCSMQ